jgi:hypothetical protein
MNGKFPFFGSAILLVTSVKGRAIRSLAAPLAGRGSAANPSITEQEAIQVRELTVALVRMERILATVSASQPSKVKKKKQTPAAKENKKRKTKWRRFHRSRADPTKFLAMLWTL